jgi:VanZ family protein
MLDVIIKKLAHFGEFAVLTLLICRAISPGSVLSRGQVFGVVGFALCYALSDEIHQSFVPGRNPSAIDFAIDAAGVAAGLAVFSRWPLLPGARHGPPRR